MRQKNSCGIAVKPVGVNSNDSHRLANFEASRLGYSHLVDLP